MIAYMYFIVNGQLDCDWAGEGVFKEGLLCYWSLSWQQHFLSEPTCTLTKMINS